MRRLILSLLACCMLAATMPAQAPIHYIVSPELAGTELRALDVEIDFTGDADGVTRVAWPDRSAGEDHLGQWARDVTVSGATSVQLGANGERFIRAAPGAPLVMRYRIVSGYDHDPTVDDWQQAWPIIRPTWFYSVGESLFAAPDGRDEAPATFDWRGAPPGFGFASDLEHLAGRSRPAVRPGTVDDVRESILIGGYGLRVTGSATHASGVRVATIGTYAFDPTTLAPEAMRVIAAERAFWKSDQHAPFLVTMAPLKVSPVSQSFSGEGRSDAFAMWVGQDIPLKMLTYLLAHEYFHTWNPRRLGGLADGPEQSRGYWFSEGFTDFYTRRLMVRAHLISPQEFVDEWNEKLLAYATSPFRTVPNDEAAAKFWTDPDAQQLPYERGALVAALWDHRLREKTGGRLSLDSILFRQRVAASRKPGDRPPYAPQLFIETMANGGFDIRSDVNRYIANGAMVILPGNAFGPCASVRTQRRPVFDIGYDNAATARGGKIVKGVNPQSRAYAAGLRNGMRIVKRLSGKFGDSLTDYVLLVSDGGAQRTIRFKPQGKARITVQQLVLDQRLASRKGEFCAASLSGLR